MLVPGSWCCCWCWYSHYNRMLLRINQQFCLWINTSPRCTFAMWPFRRQPAQPHDDADAVSQSTVIHYLIGFILHSISGSIPGLLPSSFLTCHFECQGVNHLSTVHYYQNMYYYWYGKEIFERQWSHLIFPLHPFLKHPNQELLQKRADLRQSVCWIWICCNAACILGLFFTQVDHNRSYGFTVYPLELLWTHTHTGEEYCALSTRRTTAHTAQVHK